ncbi:EF-hand domain-containing protein [Phaeovulum vinaykumarii]|uniref:EF hand n=1 Tax=Phaeovulum vinaykumarii TaxID=407234 RepID=A0A1N7KVK7_9RHOB|nr:hypothetical protein [Phaeovulum vinaykumarii]SIS65567.1 EF hand [Phaeovulum vinaykumarii]SOC01240.1 EF hand domain-containing protein [Phaeovulum vinaykumarii]
MKMNRFWSAGVSALVAAGVLGTVLPAMANDAPVAPRAGAMGPAMDGAPLMRRGVIDLMTLDADGDGRVTPEEIAAGRAAKVAGIDADKDGKISQAELVAQSMARHREVAERMAAERIKAQDADGDGLLSAEELLARPAPSARLFDRLDRNDDGALDRDELARAQARMDRHFGRDRDRGDRFAHRMSPWGKDCDRGAPMAPPANAPAE